MELTIVGCSGSVSGPESPASSYLVQAPYEGRTFSLVLDLGPGAFGALYRYLDPSEVDAIALSHLHPDHCLDLCAYYVGARYSPTAPWPRRPVYGPPGTAERFLRAYEVPVGGAGEIEGPPGIATFFGYSEWQEHQQVGPFDVRVARVDHPVPAYAIRLQERQDPSATLVFSGDTGPCAALVDLATGADTLLAESAFMHAPDNPTGIHLSGVDAAVAATVAGVRRLILTHIPPWHAPAAVRAEAAPHFAGALELAAPGARWRVGRA